MSSTLLLPLSYVKWHYTTAYVDFYRIAKNYLWFFWHFFAIPLHLRTLFIPWRRLSEETGRYFDLERTFERIIVNTLMRVVGMLIRLIFIFIGLIVIASAFIMVVIAGIFWTMLPVFLIYIIIGGFTSFI